MQTNFRVTMVLHCYAYKVILDRWHGGAAINFNVAGCPLKFWVPIVTLALKILMKSYYKEQTKMCTLFKDDKQKIRVRRVY